MFQLINNDARLFRSPRIELRTTEVWLPVQGSIVYETCLFTDEGSVTLAAYNDIEEAIRFHRIRSRDLGLSNTVQP